MSKKIWWVLMATGALFFVIGRTTAQSQAKLSQQTMENLLAAMHGEAFAFAKYTLYAEHARKEGNAALARLFEKAAQTERLDHFAREAALAGVVSSDSENLQDAIRGESYEVDTMYRNFADQAKAAGENTAADRFEEIRRDEMGHRDAFKAALAKIETTEGEER